MQTRQSDLIERESVVLHKGKQILRHDYSGLQGTQFSQLVSLHTDAVVSRAQRDLCILVVMKNTVVDKAVIQAFKTGGLAVRPFYGKVAMVGFGSLQKFFIQIVAKFTAISPGLFDSEEEAMDWLVK